MRTLDGEQVLVRIFIGEADRWQHQQLATALVERLRKEGFAGATVLRGVAGFGARSILHTAQILRLSEDLPIVIEVVDSESQVERLVLILDEMIKGGLVTMEKVHVLQYGAGPRDPSAAPPTSAPPASSPESAG